MKADELLRKYESGEATQAERAIVESWYLKQDSSHEADVKDVLDDYFSVKENLLTHANAGQENSSKRKHNPIFTHPYLPRMAAAAVLIACLGTAFYFIQKQPKKDVLVANNIMEHDIAPGGNRATLTFDDGTHIALNAEKEGIVAGADQLTYSDGGRVMMEEQPVATGHFALTTPHGGTYQIKLADGTKAWLNAGSTLKYPAEFIGNERRVAIEGEVYFEVAKDRNRPFIVSSQGQEVQVLGTQFNINAYPFEGMTRTTLIEGSVQITNTSKAITNHKITLRPNQQSIIANNQEKIQVRTVDPETVIAWKNGYFIFDDETLESIMQKIAIWYDVDIIYQDDLKNLKFGGIIARSNPISEVLKLLERTGNVNFNVTGKKVTILK